MTDPQVALLMLGGFIFLIMLGFPIAFTLMGLAVGFRYYAYFDWARLLRRMARLAADAPGPLVTLASWSAAVVWNRRTAHRRGEKARVRSRRDRGAPTQSTK